MMKKAEVKITKKLIETKLKNVIDPELGINIVDLGLIYKIKVQKKVSILMTLTSPGMSAGCGFSAFSQAGSGRYSGFNQYKDLVLELTFDPPWHQDMMSERAKAELGF